MIPNYSDKYEAEALFSPEEAVETQGDGLPDIPAAVILGYRDALTESVQDRAESKVDIVRSQYLYKLSGAVGFVPVREWGIGAPVSAIITENVIAAGATSVVMLGGCGCLQESISPDTVILPTRSIRDEGVSYHYVPDSEPVRATTSLVDSLADSLSAAGFDTERGTTWTTSAMYRETIPEIDKYQRDGVVSLCMESAAIWAVCQYRGVDTATVHGVGDYLTPDDWIPESDGEKDPIDMLAPTVKALEEHVGQSNDASSI